MGFTPNRKYERAPHAIDQRAFDERGNVVGIDEQDVDHVWADVLSVGKKFLLNIADEVLGVSMQPRRGEILITRSERTQETRAVSYRARKHERPKRTLTHWQVAPQLPRESERRSLDTARHSRHSRGYFPSAKAEGGITAYRKLSLGGFKSNLGREYELLALMEERAAEYQKRESAWKKSQPPTDDIKF